MNWHECSTITLGIKNEEIDHMITFDIMNLEMDSARIYARHSLWTYFKVAFRIDWKENCYMYI